MPTDLQLQLALAKMGPQIHYDKDFRNFWWNKPLQSVRDTEWLHACWLVEQTLDTKTASGYVKELNQIAGIEDWMNGIGAFYLCHASWQQRAQALCKVKGVEI